MNQIRDIVKEAQVGSVAPNPMLMDLSTKASKPLLSFAKAGRPLIVNFGSCTWPPFMASLGKFGALRTKFAGLVDFVTIYIAEAHPAERKHFSGNFDISTHSSMEERIEAARTMKEEAGESLDGCPILVRNVST